MKGMDKDNAALQGAEGAEKAGAAHVTRPDAAAIPEDGDSAAPGSVAAGAAPAGAPG